MEQHSKMNFPVAVIGGGVSGLTVGLQLLQQGFPVTIYAKKFGIETTSLIAGALWELPHAVCGHTDAKEDQLLSTLEEWSCQSYHYFLGLKDIPEAGVWLRRVNFYTELPLSEDEETQRKIKVLSKFVRGLEVSQREVPPPYAFSYSYLAPMVDMATYLPFLQNEIFRLGGSLQIATFNSKELKNLSEFKQKHKAEILINCAGLGAKELAGDKRVFPVRGAWYLFENNGSLFPEIKEAHCASLTDGREHFVFVLPRGKDKLVIGGTANPNVEQLEMAIKDPILQKMLGDSTQFLPELKDLKAHQSIDFKVGLRPFRTGSVRLERDEQGIIHNYGHGGSGVLLSWGCARDVLKLVRVNAGLYSK